MLGGITPQTQITQRPALGRDPIDLGRYDVVRIDRRRVADGQRHVTQWRLHLRHPPEVDHQEALDLGAVVKGAPSRGGLRTGKGADQLLIVVGAYAAVLMHAAGIAVAGALTAPHDRGEGRNDQRLSRQQPGPDQVLDLGEVAIPGVGAPVGDLRGVRQEDKTVPVEKGGDVSIALQRASVVNTCERPLRRRRRRRVEPDLEAALGTKARRKGVERGLDHGVNIEVFRPWEMPSLSLARDNKPSAVRPPLS